MCDAQEQGESPVKTVLQAIVAAKKCEKTEVYSYKNADDFSSLWMMLDNSEAQEDPKYIVIVWDDFPETKEDMGAVNLGSVLTPYDWALVYSYVHKTALPTISIVDLNKGGNDLNKDEKLHGLLEKIPWIKCYRPVKNKPYDGFEEMITSVCGDSLGELDKDITTRIKHRYRKLIQHHDNHHDIANLVAPMVMASGLPKTSNTQQESTEQALIGKKQAFYSLLQKFFPVSHINPDNSKFPILKKYTKPAWMDRCPTFPRFVLIDDQAEHFKCVCEQALGIESLQCYETLSNYKENNSDIVFLDLRLTASKDNSDKNGSKSLQPLTENPIKLAKAKPARPIIIFSSTQQRYVTEAFKPYPNIITRFIKPYPGEYIETMDPKVIMDGFYEAVTSALEMYEVGVVWRETENGNVKNIKKLYWGGCSGCGLLVDDEEHPWTWLKEEWLPVMQRGNYAIAATLPWMHLRNMLGATRMDILQRRLSIKNTDDVRHEDERGLFEIIRKGNLLFPMTNLKDLITDKNNQTVVFDNNKEENSEGGLENKLKMRQREIAIAVGRAFVSLIVIWKNTTMCEAQ